MLPTPTASSHAAERTPQIGGQRPSGSKRQAALTDVITHRLGPLYQDSAAAGRQRLLPTPDADTTPRSHGRRGGRPGNGHQSGQGLDSAARTLATTTPPRGIASPVSVAWGEFEPAIRRWESVLGEPAPPPAEPGPGGRPRLSAVFAEWMMGIPGLVTGVPDIPRTAQLRIIGNGVVPAQAAAALRLLAQIAALPGPDPVAEQAAA